MSKLRDFITKWWGTGTEDDWRNFGWRISEALRVQVSWAWTIIDFGIYPFRFKLPYRTQQNFWNGFFTVQIYVVGWKWFMWPTLHIVFRPVKSHFLLIATPGLLFDRGEFHCKVAVMSPEPSEPQGYEEGSV
jgi:hypothetical protein